MELNIKKPENTPLIKANGLFGIKNLFIKDETKHPTHTFKDRMAYEMIAPLIEKIESGEQVEKITFGCISYGNMAISMGHYINLLNSKSGQNIARAVIFIPDDLTHRKFGPDTNGKKISGRELISKISETCKIIELNLEKEFYSTEKLKKIAEECGLLEGKFINITEGLGRPAYENIFIEIVNQLDKVPDYVIVPFGSGVLCNEIIEVIKQNKYKTEVVPVSVGRKESIAIMLYGLYWLDRRELEETGKTKSKHEKYPCLVYNVQDKEILDAMNVIRKIVTAEPSGAAGFAILHRLEKIYPELDLDKDYVVVIDTGNGLLNF